MVKRRTKYIISFTELISVDSVFLETAMVSANTRKGLIRKIRSFPIDRNVDSYLRFTKLVKSHQRIKFYEAKIDRVADVKNLVHCKSIRAMWRTWHRLVGCIIPDGFRVLTNKWAPLPTALSIRNRLRSLVPTQYNCYLLDRDLRRYLGLELRHD